ncbi:MAG: nicotinate phosphoribosyltransferase [Alphaproteobacteria bacterium]|nr:nicotinate phosphoribosyltransferase [Alphaproteobacteria bacterium]MDA8006216.1 nicotinate phosphoribosyltransferase [Alphaproteobacteria bacterium]MDA8013578.1 nicotinate phosphoribosyltransferase [Alphaproteobacteria bacterium]
MMTGDPAAPEASSLRISQRPRDEGDVGEQTDIYFRRTRDLLRAEAATREVTYAIFLRRPTLSAPGIAVNWIQSVAESRGADIKCVLRYREGEWVGAGEPLLYVKGPFVHLADLETLLLQKIGAPCVAAHNAYRIARALPKTAFIAMDARHCAGAEMSEAMAYAAAVGSDRARRVDGAVGFIGASTDAAARAFGQKSGLGTMPHAWVGHCGSTLEAAVRYEKQWHNEDITVLVDYYAREVTDSLAVASHFHERAAKGGLAVRIDVAGSRYIEGLSPPKSYEVLERRAPEALRRYLTAEQQKFLIGPGVSAAAIWHLRDALDGAGFDKVKITASSGFGPEKCEAIALANVPLDCVGTGSFLPERWSETYATADVVEYDGEERVKVGREFLLPSRNPTSDGEGQGLLKGDSDPAAVPGDNDGQKDDKKGAAPFHGQHNDDNNGAAVSGDNNGAAVSGDNDGQKDDNKGVAPVNSPHDDDKKGVAVHGQMNNDNDNDDDNGRGQSVAEDKDDNKGGGAVNSPHDDDDNDGGGQKS